jgi:hypothetical protein
VIPSVAAVRQAAGLVDLAREDALHARTRDLINQAKANPVRAVELISLLAEMVAVLQRRDREPPTELHEEYLRYTHAAYERGDRFGWVIAGEREYQRLKKRRQRKEVTA